eukprot:8178854-Lingulodinium_polyedra.AAC.1
MPNKTLDCWRQWGVLRDSKVAELHHRAQIEVPEQPVSDLRPTKAEFVSKPHTPSLDASSIHG